MTDNLKELAARLAAFGSPRVALVGDFMLDRYVYGDVERISPEAPVPVLRVNSREVRAGGAGSVAAALQALGARTLCLGATGQDADGKELRELLAATGADVSGLVPCPDRCTTVKTRLVGLAQQKSPHQMLRVDDEPPPAADRDWPDALRAAWRKALRAADIVAVQDHNKGLVTDRTCRALLSDARAARVRAIVDPARVSDYGRYRGAAALLPNRWETALASGMTLSDEASLRRAATRLMEAAEAEAVLVKLDRDGMYLLERGSPGRAIGTRPRAVYDSTGAGDATLAMFVTAMAGGCSFREAAVLANVAGGLEVEQFGVVPIPRAQAVAEVERMAGLRGSKVLDRQTLRAEIERRRRAGQTVVFTNGCFDLLHTGHLMHLRQAAELGSCLVVALNSDESVRRLKGPPRPLIAQNERAEILAALECVDYVTVFDEDTPVALLETLRPDVLVKGGETENIVGAEVVTAYGGKVQRLRRLDAVSTGDIIDRIAGQA